MADQLGQQLTSARLSEIERDAALVGVEVEKQAALLGMRVPPGKGPRWRDRSPVRGGSTLMTSAPRSAISLVAYAAATMWPHSITRNPANAWSAYWSLVAAACTMNGPRFLAACRTWQAPSDQRERPAERTLPAGPRPQARK